jgi:tetratricopeptide (TPR) repeat protein
MDKIMVLNRHFSIHVLPVLFMALCLNACSHLSSQSHDNRSPNKPIVPAESRQVLFPNKPNIKEISPDPSSKENQEQTTPSIETQTISEEIPSKPVGKSLKPADVLASIVDSAKKAIQMQQWLRAQHHLEHALRIAPKDAEVFYLYGQVYEGLGVQEQTINMLKRALFLAKPDSRIYNLAKEKLK